MLVYTVAAALGPPVTSAPAPRVPDSLETSVALAKALGNARPSYLRTDEWVTVRRLTRWASASRVITPLWLDGERVALRAMALAAALDSVEKLGLRPADYRVAALTAALRAASRPSPNTNATTLAHTDLLLTASFVSLVDDLLTGRVDPRNVEPTWHIAPRAFDVAARITAALDSVRAGRPIRDVLAGLRPEYGSYGALIQALARYRAFERDGGWPVLPNEAVPRTGRAGSIVPALRRRLAAEGYLTSASGSDTLDTVVSVAIAEFQRRHGLAVDSLVGPRTRAALNVSASHRVRQIEANLERLRWLPPNPGDRFVVVNVPAFTLYAFDGTTRALTMRVVVGDELVSRRTPIFADTMEFVEFGPYWNVPRSIAVKEILPQARRDATAVTSRAITIRSCAAGGTTPR